MVPRENVDAKAARFLRAGRVQERPERARMFEVDGDHGKYRVLVSAQYRTCDCPATSECSHIRAVLEWMRAEAEELVGGDPTRINEYRRASASRRTEL